MFSVTRFFTTGAGKKSLNVGMKSRMQSKLSSGNGGLFKLQVASFGGKSRDSNVDKSKKSVSGSTTASESEVRREVSKQTVKVGKTDQEQTLQGGKQATGPKTSSNIPTGSQPGTTPSTSDAKRPSSETKTATGGEPSVKVITSVPGNKPPTSEDTIAGRYAHTLFVVASEENNLYKVYEDMKYVSHLYENLPSFRIFADNSGLNASQIYSFSEELAKCGDLCSTTLKFCDLLGKNKRFMYINDIAKKYIRTYLLLTKEEKITIISAQELTASERSQVSQSLSANPENAGKTFIIDYQVNSSIIGGLQMYTENKFMDLSLSSRLDKIKDELNKLI